MAPKRASAPPQKSGSPLMAFLIRFLIQVTLAISFLVGSTYFALWKRPDLIADRLPHIHSFGDRLTFALRCQAFTLPVLVGSVILVIFGRVGSGVVNPLENREHIIQVHKQCLQNTLEQFVIACSSHAVLSTYLNEDEMKIIPLLVFFFVVGRVTFTLGYLISPYYRTFGFLTTFFSNVFSVGYCLYFVITRGIGFNLGAEMYKA